MWDSSQRALDSFRSVAGVCAIARVCGGAGGAAHHLCAGAQLPVVLQQQDGCRRQLCCVAGASRMPRLLPRPAAH